MSVLRACVRSPESWAPVLVEDDGSELSAFPLVPTDGCRPEDVACFTRTGEGGLVLRLDDLFGRLRATRHAINNPLAAALVEVQLLLMDASDDETRRAFGVVQDQLRQIKNLVAGLALPVERGRRRPSP